MKKIGLLVGLMGLAMAAQINYFTLKDLSKYNGQDGQLPYVAINGMVYNVVSANGWVNGGYKGYLSGQDINTFPELADSRKQIMQTAPVVGKLISSFTERQVQKYNGKNGKPSYMGYGGVVYDVSQSASYKKYAGQCLQNITIDVNGLPVIGQLL
ncbi:MAG: hypothetical protein AABZ14_06400 [Candidatus Margulisiibacteriota bacterium]